MSGVEETDADEDAIVNSVENNSESYDPVLAYQDIVRIYMHQ